MGAFLPWPMAPESQSKLAGLYRWDGCRSGCAGAIAPSGFRGSILFLSQDMLSTPSTAVRIDPQRMLRSIDTPADWIGLRIVKSSEAVRGIRDQKPQTNGVQTRYGAMVEVLLDGQVGYGATANLTPAALQRAATAASLQAKAAAAWGLYPFTDQIRPPITGQHRTALGRDLDSLSAGALNDLLIRICRRLQVSDKIIQTSATALVTERETWFVSNHGSDAYQQSASVIADYDATAKDGLLTQKRSANGWFARAYQGGWEWLLTDDLWERVDRVACQALELLSAPDCPSDRRTLVLTPDQMMLQLHESVGHPLELDRILGDERNYAGGSFVRPQDFGSLNYGSDLMNVTFDPTVAGELASYGYDDTGVSAHRAHLIRGGRLERGLGSIESQLRSGLPGVACARACSWNRPAIDRMANINLEPGETAFNDMIAQIERGVLMQSNRSWSIDDQRYKFQFGCEYAQLIEDGAIGPTVRNPNYRSTTPAFWRSLSQVGDRNSWEIFGTPVCGKGEPNQIIWVGHAAPICAFDNIDVFGGGA